jgi:hypothetical protein
LIKNFGLPVPNREHSFFDVPILFVNDRKIRQGFDRLVPGGMNGFVFRRSYREQFRQTHFKAGGNVRIFGKMQLFSTASKGNLFSSVVSLLHFSYGFV